MNKERLFILRALIATTSIFSQECFSFERREVIEAVESIAVQQKNLNQEILKLKKLLGMQTALNDLTVITDVDSLSKTGRLRTEKGIDAFELEDYEKAKDEFQIAWEEQSESAITNYNLAITYQRLGKIASAKQMFKTCLDLNENIEGSDQIAAFIEGKNFDDALSDMEEEDKKAIHSEMTNLKMKANSFTSSQTLSKGKRIASTAKVLDEMIKLAEENEELIEDYYLWIAETYASFEWYDQAAQILQSYEEEMKGKVLSESYHKKKLAIEEKQKDLEKKLEVCSGQTPTKELQFKLYKDLKELEIFALQMNEFVHQVNEEDPDFSKICKRLEDYKWAGQPKKHVVVVNRSRELLYSSLPGTLEIDRYQDVNGEMFLKNITLFADRLNLKQTEFFRVELKVNGTVVPYVVLYSYVPKHQSFIIVKVPERDFV